MTELQLKKEEKPFKNKDSTIFNVEFLKNFVVRKVEWFKTVMCLIKTDWLCTCFPFSSLYSLTTNSNPHSTIINC